MKYQDGFQAITTKSIGPTVHRGARIKATAAAGSVTISRGYDDTEYNQHKEVAKELCKKFGWTYDDLFGAGLPNGNFMWVMVKKR